MADTISVNNNNGVNVTQMGDKDCVSMSAFL